MNWSCSCPNFEQLKKKFGVYFQLKKMCSSLSNEAEIHNVLREAFTKKNLTIPCEDTGAPDYTVQTYFVKSSKFGQLG